MGKFYNCDALKLTYSNFHVMLMELPKIRRWENGQPLDERDAMYEYAKSLSPQQFLQAVMRGEIPIDILVPKNTAKTDAEKKAAESEVARLLEGNQNKAAQQRETLIKSVAKQIATSFSRKADGTVVSA